MKKIPVVVVLGHIDHGKTSLLEAIRKDFTLTKKEAGGITQHIGAYEVDFKGQKMTFIDTPGHEAFSQMRERGAKVADLAILVVAADEGVMPQTKEAIQILKKEKLPFVVAINKVDKPNVNLFKVKKELQEAQVFIEEYGGDVPCQEISAKTGQGIEELLETISLLWEMQEKKEAGEEFLAFAIEGFVDPKRGVTVSLIIESGKLQVGDVIGSKTTFGKVRILEDFQGKPKKVALAGEVALVIGIRDVPVLGEIFKKFKNEKEAEEFLLSKKEISFEKVDVTAPVLKIILKCDVAGTLQALLEILKKIGKEKIAIAKGDVGEVDFDDIKLAEEVNAKIFVFRAKVPPAIQNLASQKKIEIYKAEVIYEILDRVQKLLEEKKEELPKERVLIGKMEVLVGFKTKSQKGKKYWQIVGGRIIEGEIKKDGEVEILRKGEMVGAGKILNLQKDKKDIEEAKAGEEVGILYEGKGKIKEGDILLIYGFKNK